MPLKRSTTIDEAAQGPLMVVRAGSLRVTPREVPGAAGRGVQGNSAVVSIERWGFRRL